MLKNLRGRFILSHILPILVIIPVMGFAMLYLIEQKILVPSLLAELKGNALVLSNLAAHEQDIWKEPGYAAQLLTKGTFYQNGRLMLLDDKRILLASSDPADQDRIGTKIDLQGVDAALQGQVVGQLYYSKVLNDDIADAIAPVIGEDGKILGFVRLSFHRFSLVDQIYQMRYLLSGIIVAGLLFGTILGIVLAITVSAPITKVTKAIDDYAKGKEDVVLPEAGATEIRDLAHSVNMMILRLDNLETARKRLLGNLVHELGRPLGALRMGIEALTLGANRDSAFFAELLGGMDQEISRLQHLLVDLTHLYEGVLGPLELNRELIELSDWLPEVLVPWHQSALQKHLHWKLNIQQDLPPVKADALRLDQVVGNLVSNAIKFTPAGGSVEIEACGEGQQICIRVKDTGPSISPELQEKIFSPFVRGGQGKRFPQGMGLGLTIARELTEAHGGKLELESEPGWGATFTVRLPL